jgi:hypothetical protein
MHCGVVQGLAKALNDDFELDVGIKFRIKRTHTEANLARQLNYQKQKRWKADEALKMFKGISSQYQRTLPRDVIVRVGLSNPLINSRQLRDMLSADGIAAIGHSSVAKVRDAFAESLKCFVKQKVAAEVAVGVIENRGKANHTFYALHVHDEALMRFRSYDKVDVEAFGGCANGPVFSRGRYSKVQNNAISVFTSPGAKPIDWLSELQPLARKTGLTVATAICTSIEEVVEACMLNLQADTPLRFLHLLVGDGVNTNENSAKRVLQRCLVNLQKNNIEYRLLVWKCSSHQSNLVVMVAIVGCLMTNVLDSNVLCATLSRLYKYLTPAYLDEFTASLRDLVVSSFTMCHDFRSDETERCQEVSRKLVALYGDHVLPHSLIRLRNKDLSRMEHLCPEGTDITTVRKAMFDLLLRLVWLVEEKPVVTRFFLFAPCCFALLRMILLGLPVTIFSAGALGMETDNSKRLKAVRAFYTDPTTPKLLRRVCLCLRLTMFATSLTAKKSKSTDAVPVLVRLGRGEVQERTSQLLVEMLPLLPNDTVLDLTDTFTSLLLTQAHLVIRFDLYLKYPTRLWTLVRKFNRELYGAVIIEFLHTDDKLLDVGYSVLLKREAWTVGKDVEADAVAYIMSDNVQAELVGVFENATATSLDVERKHASDKKFETTKVTGCAAASRNCILRKYLSSRRVVLDCKNNATASYKKIMHLNIRALALERRPELFPRARGKLHWQLDVSRADQKVIVNEGDPAALSKYIEENKEQLEAELSSRKNAMKHKAAAKAAIPMTHDDWLKHIVDNDEEFSELLQSASKQRRSVSERLRADPEWGEVPRIYPRICREHGHSPEWSHLRPGFYCFKHLDFLLVCFVASIGHTVFACPLSSTAANQEYEFVYRPLFHKAFKPIGLVFDCAGLTDDVEAYKLDYEAKDFRIDRVVIMMTGAAVIERPARATAAAASSHEGPAVDVEECDDDQELRDYFAKVDDVADSDCESVCSSKDTSIDSSDDSVSDVGSESSDEVQMGKKAKAAGGTWSVYSNGYFTFTDNPQYPDVKARAVDRWCNAECMGVAGKSKTVVPEHFGEDRSAPHRSMLVLKAWMLWKANTNDFCNKRASRRRLFAKEAIDLRLAISSMSCAVAPTTGNEHADSMIRKWMPQVLVPATVSVVD